MNRRDLLIKSLQAAGLVFLSGVEAIAKPYGDSSAKMSLRADALARIGNPLRFPPLFTNGGTMTLAQTNFEVWPGQQTQIIGVNNSYPGPTVRINRGQTFTVNFFNSLLEPATTHWHGVIVPELMDGHPKDAIPSGSAKTYTFPIIQRSGTYFYHSHANMLTGKQVYKGFAGFFIIDDPNEPNYGLPAGSYDVPLCIQDHRAADRPNFNYTVGMDELHFGYLGDTVLVNGTPEAYFEVSRTLYRFRILNGSNARVYKIAMSDNHPFHIIATDSGLKDSPAQVTNFMLSPGERVDILMDFSTYSLSQSVTLKTLPFTWNGTGTYRQGIEMDILRFDVTGSNSSGGIVPGSLAPITYYNPNDVTQVRNFNLSLISGSMNIHRINGYTFDINRIDWETPQYALEEWKIFNNTGDYHPMHAHGVLWQLYSRNGNTNLAPNDKGWKDTVLVNPYETVRVLVKFNDYKGIYLFHCHNLEHEDDGMMLNFKVIDPIGIKQIGTQVPEEFKLHQNYPNPFNPSTKIRFSLPKPFKGGAHDIKLVVYDIRGKEIKSLYTGSLPPGIYEAEFDGSNFSSGIYFTKLTARQAGYSTGDFIHTIKMILSK